MIMGHSAQQKSVTNLPPVERCILSVESVVFRSLTLADKSLRRLSAGEMVG